MALFIDGEYLNPEKVYESYPTPRLLTHFELKLKYVYNYIFEGWFVSWKFVVAKVLKSTIVPFTEDASSPETANGQSLYQLLMPHSEDFFRIKAHT